VKIRAQAGAEISLDVVRRAPVFRRPLVRLDRLESLTNHSVLEELASCRVEIVGEEGDRLRRCLHLGTTIRRKAFCPASKLVDLPVVHDFSSSP